MCIRDRGVDAAGLARKMEVVREALDHHRLDGSDTLGVLAAAGGLEIAAMAGPTLRGAAALVATRLSPGVRDFLCFSHLSAERGHRVVCDVLDARPLLDLGMRLGEGTG